MSGKKILMITGDFTEDYETMVPFQAAAHTHSLHIDGVATSIRMENAFYVSAQMLSY